MPWGAGGGGVGRLKAARGMERQQGVWSGRAWRDRGGSAGGDQLTGGANGGKSGQIGRRGGGCVGRWCWWEVVAR